MPSSADYMDEYEARHAKQMSRNLVNLRVNVAHENVVFRFANDIGIHYSHVQALENERIWRNPSLANVMAYRTYFKKNFGVEVSADYLLGFTDKL